MEISKLIQQTGEYHQGWNAISLELSKRLLLVPYIKHSYPFIKFVQENANSNTWIEAFADNDIYRESKKIVASVAMVNRAGIPRISLKEDGNTYFERISSIQIQLFYGWPNFERWSEICDAVSVIFAEGDRTLNRTCLTHSAPTAGENDIASFGGVDCHYLYMSMEIEEAGEYNVG